MQKLLQAVACEPTAQQTGLASAMLSYIPLISGDQVKYALLYIYVQSLSMKTSYWDAD